MKRGIRSAGHVVLVSLTSLSVGCLTGASTADVAAGGQQGLVNVDEIVPKLAGLVEEHTLTDARIQKAVATVVDQRTQNVWNDVRPWITGAVATVAIVAAAAVVVLVVWIRWNSYLRQKPAYERLRGRSGG